MTDIEESYEDQVWGRDIFNSGELEDPDLPEIYDTDEYDDLDEDFFYA